MESRAFTKSRCTNSGSARAGGKIGLPILDGRQERSGANHLLEGGTGFLQGGCDDLQASSRLGSGISNGHVSKALFDSATTNHLKFPRDNS